MAGAVLPDFSWWEGIRRYAMHQFQDELRQALWKYALLPVLLLTVAGLLLIMGSWQHYVVEDNARQRQQLVSGIQIILDDGAKRVDRIAEQWEAAPRSIEKIHMYYGRV